MFGSLLKRLWRRSPPHPWVVTVTDDVITTDDGRGTVKKLSTTDLHKVIVATDDSGPWGNDVVFLLFTQSPEPVGIFPLEAKDVRSSSNGWLDALDTGIGS
jgi:hypothetical protein